MEREGQLETRGPIGGGWRGMVSWRQADYGEEARDGRGWRGERVSWRPEDQEAEEVESSGDKRYNGRRLERESQLETRGPMGEG